MKKLLVAFLLLLSAFGYGQSETHNFTTYDTTIVVNGYSWGARITRPVNYFTPNHPDTASRPLILMMGGAGEVGSDLSLMRSNGPHQQLAAGTWDGSVVLGNGTHYPLIISVQASAVNPQVNKIIDIFYFIFNKFHPRSGSVHCTGLSMGAFSWSSMINGQTVAGDEIGMKNVRSLALLEGQSNGYTAGNMGSSTPYSTDWKVFGHWAKKYGGKFFGLEGTNDGRDLWRVQQPMNDSMPGSAYFAFQNIGGGAHCCWIQMYDTARTNWTSVGTLGPNIATNTFYPNSMGTYKKGDFIYRWQLRQGDTTLVGGAGSPVLANAGADQTTSATNATLNGSASSGSITSYAWTRISGPNTPTVATPSNVSTTIGVGGTSLITGTYVYRLTVSDGTNTSTDDITVTRNTPGNVLPVSNAGADKSINAPNDSSRVIGTASDGDGTVASTVWSQVSGPGTAVIRTPNALTTDIVAMITGTYFFRLTVTDNSGGVATDDVGITVVAQSGTTPKKVNINIYGGTNPYNAVAWNDLNTSTSANTTFNNLKYDDATTSPYSVTFTTFNQIADNGAAFGGGMAPAEVLRYASYYAGGNRTITVNNLDDSRTYNLILYGARANNATNYSTAFVINGTTNTITTDTNHVRSAVFTAVQSTNGTVTIQVNRVASGTTYVNGMVIEETGAISQNQPPIVNAGVDQAVTLPTSIATLTGTVTDEGGALSYTWTKVSGPTGGGITSPATITTGITGLQVGTYVYQLAVTDAGNLTGTDQMVIVVNAAGNVLPVANAGGNQSITAPTSGLSLSGSGTDADGTIVAYQWSIISSVGSPVITAPTSAGTTFTNLIPGTYIVRLRVTDNSGGTATDDATITVNSAPTQFTDNLPKTLVGQGEYQAYFIDSLRHLSGVGNITNIGTNGAGTEGVAYRALVTPSNLKFKYVVGALHGGAAIDTAGRGWVMGDNDQGQMGRGNLTASLLPEMILTDTTGATFDHLVAITSFFVKQSNGFIALKDDGTIWGWGRMLGGMRGNGTDSTHADSFCLRPIQIIMPGGRLVKQVIAGLCVVVLCTDGTVWTWGNVGYTNLGYAGTGTDYQTPHQLTTLSGIDQIAGAGLFNYALKADGTTLYGWGSWGNYMGDTFFPTGGGVTYPTPRLLPNITSKLPFPIRKIVTNTAATYVILTNGSLWSWGDNAQGNIGNGKQLAHANPYAWDFGTGELLVKDPYNIAPGRVFADVFGSNVFTYSAYAVDSSNVVLGWGKGKASVIGVRIRAASSNLTATYGNSWDVPWPKIIAPQGSYSTSFISTSPVCITSPGGSPCNEYSIPANTKPVPAPGSTQNITTTSTILNGSGSTDNVWISYYEWKQLSGPTTAVMDLPGNPITSVKNLATGVYTFQLRTTDNGWLSDSAVVTVNVNQSGNTPPTANAGSNVSITLPINAVSLTGTGNDIGGTIVGYAWSKAPGTTLGTITAPTSAVTSITGLTIPGTYQYVLTVTDNDGGTATSTVSIIVSAQLGGGRNRAKFFKSKVGRF